MRMAKLVQATQEGFGVSTLGQTQKPTGCGPEQPALGSPALSKGLDQGISKEYFVLESTDARFFVFFILLKISAPEEKYCM